MFKIFQAIIRKLKNLHNRILLTINDKDTSNLIRHNNLYFIAKHFNKNRKRKKVLFEFNTMQPSHIAFSYFAKVLSSNYEYSLVAYQIDRPLYIKDRFFRRLYILFNSNSYGIYKSFGIKTFISPHFNYKTKIHAKKHSNLLISQIKCKSDILKIKINEVNLGDLIYDTYLRTFNKPTIEIKDINFKKFLYKQICLFFYWDNYFIKNNIAAINVTHCVYNNAFPLRIAISRQIPAYQCNITHVYSLSKDRPFAYTDFYNFKEDFKRLPNLIKEQGLETARNRINERFNGKVGVDMSYSTKSAFGKFKEQRLIKESNNIKILIATHCFFDSPHSYGENLFPDFFEWLDYLGDISNKTNYDWYIKTHPDYLPFTMDIIRYFTNKYKKIHLLPSDSSHHQLITEGINFVLTCYGTIGFEYAAMGITVINASINNPHIAYDFNVHPKSVSEYFNILINLDTLNHKINKNEVFEYYFMKFIFNANNIFFQDYEKMENHFGGYLGQFTSGLYKYWLESFSIKHHNDILLSLENFIKSKNFRLIPSDINLK